MIDIEAIRARAEAAVGLIDIQPSISISKHFAIQLGRDIKTLIAEVEQLRAENKVLYSELYPAKEIEEQRAKRWEAEKRLLQKTRAELDRVTAERDAAVKDIYTSYDDGLCEVCGRRATCLMTLDSGDPDHRCYGKGFEWRGIERSK